MGITYKDSGVDIAAGEATVEKIKPLVRSTFNENVLADIGLFGGFYDARFSDYNHPILVASTDGVGTKLKVAVLTGRHDTIGQCLVNHCTNDILCCGAKPLFFLDYFATGKLLPDVAAKVIEGFTIACKENNCALIGGETAEMPSMYSDGEYDVSGTIIGIVEKAKIVNGKNIKKGDILLALPSSGLHTNGYSLARNVLLDKFKIDEFIPELGMTIGESLLSIHKSYLNSVFPLADDSLLNGISHITGGGIIGNTSRIVPKEFNLSIDWNSWQRPAIFNLIQETGNVPENDMRQTFNLGIGLILVVSHDKIDTVMNKLINEKPFIIGNIQ